MTEIVDITKVEIKGRIFDWLNKGFPKPADRILKLTQTQLERVYGEVNGKLTEEDLVDAVEDGSATYGSWQLEVAK